MLRCLLILCAVVCTLGNMYADPSLNTPENNARIIDEVKKGMHHGHGDGGHGHTHGDGKPCPHAHGGHAHEEHAHEGHGHGAAHEGHGHAHKKREAEGHGHAHEEHGHAHDEGHGHTHGPGDSCCIWTKAMGATLLISGAPFLILYLIPIDKKNDKQDKLLKVLLAFASGGLLGDAFLHLIPHAISPHSHGEEGHGHSHREPSGGGHGHSHGVEMTVGLWTLGGLLTFLLVEKLVMAVKGGGGHSHSHGPVAPKADEKKAKGSDDEGEKEEETTVCEEVPKIKVAAYLNMAADMAHNFTDGLAIGSSFLVSEKMGWMTTMLILIHEVPHEIGDFAILVQSGFTKKDAMNFQLVTALGALLGTATSVLAGGLLEGATQSILPFTAGGFIYIATVSVIPELLSGDSSLWQGVKEILALVTGIALMVVIAEYE